MDVIACVSQAASVVSRRPPLLQSEDQCEIPALEFIMHVETLDGEDRAGENGLAIPQTVTEPSGNMDAFLGAANTCHVKASQVLSHLLLCHLTAGNKHKIM